MKKRSGGGQCSSISYQVGETFGRFPFPDVGAVRRPSQNTTEDLHQHSQAVAFVATWRQEKRFYSSARYKNDTSAL